MFIKRLKGKIRFYKSILPFVRKTLTKPRNTSFEINGMRVSRFYWLRYTCRALRRIATIDGWY